MDERPGVQVIGLTPPGLPLFPDKAVAAGRDYECIRHGTVSILAGIDLYSGNIFANVEDRCRSVEFCALLKQSDTHFHNEAIVRVVLDNRFAAISGESMACLSKRPWRFEVVHTPKHGLWLNLIECRFSKIARIFLRHVRVSEKEEPKERVLKDITAISAAPVVFCLNKFDSGQLHNVVKSDMLL